MVFHICVINSSISLMFYVITLNWLYFKPFIPEDDTDALFLNFFRAQ
jgi:hypothetical protein